MHIAPFSIKVSFYRMMQVQIDLVFLLYFYMTNEINSVLQTLSSIESRENDLRIKVPTWSNAVFLSKIPSIMNITIGQFVSSTIGISFFIITYIQLHEKFAL